jgi:hypothetical protein
MGFSGNGMERGEYRETEESLPFAILRIRDEADFKRKIAKDAKKDLDGGIFANLATFR